MMSIDVVFMIGSYGHYFAWNVYTYSDLNLEKEMILPFSPCGNSHVFSNPSVNTCAVINDELGKNIVHLRHNPNKLIEYIDNHCYKNAKLYKEDNFFLPRSMFNPDMNNWKDGSDKVQLWQYREWLSFFLPDNIKNLNEEFSNIAWEGRDVACVEVDLMLEDMRTALSMVFDTKGLKFNHLATQIENTHATFLSLQRNIGLDQRLEYYVQQTITGVDIPIPPMSLIAQAWTQHLLRQNGYELECYGLNDFPDSTAALRSLCLSA